MPSYRDILQQVREKASRLEQKASSPNGNLRHEIRKFTAKPDSDELMKTGLEELSVVLRDMRKNRLYEETRRAVRALEDAETELESLNEQIDAAVTEAYISIESHKKIPDDFYDSLCVLFELWRSAEQKRQENMAIVVDISERLERAIEMCDRFRLLHEEAPSNKPSKYDTHYFRGFETDHLLLLKDLLFSMANLLVLKQARALSISSAFARALTYELTQTTPILPLKFFNHATMKALRKSVQRSMLMRKSMEGELPQVLRLHRAVTEAVPEETEAQNSFYGKISDIIISLCASNYKKEASMASTSTYDESVASSEALAATSELNTLLANNSELFVRRMFLLEFAALRLASSGVDLDSSDVEAALSNEKAFRFLVVTALVLRNSVYTEEYMDWASWYLPEEILPIVSPLNFVLEHGAIQELLSPAHLPAEILIQEGFDPQNLSPYLPYFTDLDPMEITALPDLLLSSNLRIGVDENRQFFIHFGIELYDNHDAEPG